MRGGDAQRDRLVALAVLAACIAALALAGSAAATPTVTFKAEPLPIAGYPHTGFILGAGTALLADTRSPEPNTAASPRR